MKTEYEATFLDVNREELIEKIKNLGGSLDRAEFTQRRITLDLPRENRDLNTWLRVRDEGDKVTLTLKSVDGENYFWTEGNSSNGG